MPEGEGPQPSDAGYWLKDAMSVADHFYDRQGAGRPPKLADHQLIANICALVAEGASPSDAAAQLGISHSNFQNWQDRGTGPDAEAGYLAFLALLNKAKQLGKSWHVRNIRWHARKNWVASAWWLERTEPEQFGRRQSVDVTHTHRAGLGRPEIKEIPFTTADAERLMLLLQANGPADPPSDAETVEGEYSEIPTD